MTLPIVDALIIGAGPAGSTAATLLAEQGMSVTLIEKDAFPRFKIGESLLPGGNHLLKRLGLWEKMDDAGFIRKYGAEFISSDGSDRVHNIFAEGLVKGLDYAYQVERARFDQLLLDNAVEKGTQLVQPARVSAVIREQDYWLVTVKNADTETAYRSRWLLDASGRAAFMGSKQQTPKDHIPYPKRFAVYSHFTGVKRNSGREAGNIRITRLKDGWFWSIPLDDEKTSVGVVSVRDRSEWQDQSFTPKAFFDQLVTRSPYLSDMLANAEAIDQFHLSADYTYSFKNYAGPNYMLLGDAAGFIDPVFSSGVYLAMRSAAMAADSIAEAHAQRRPLTEKECGQYTRKLKSNVRIMRDLIEVYYDQKSFSVFMAPGKRWQLFEAVNSIVAGNSNPNFAVWWRFKLFLLVCKLNRHFNLVADQRLV
jgi:flavin-dependent dehydrogenase